MSAVRMMSSVSRRLKAVLGAGGVSVQAFALCQGHRHRTQGLRASMRDMDQAGTLLEIINAQRRRKSRCARCGQNVIGAGTVIAQRFGAVWSKENGACMADQVGPLLWVFGQDFKVLGCNVVGDFAGLFKAGYLYQCAAV